MSVELKLSSGYIISVKPLTPYYMDVVDALFPLLKLPKRQLELAFTDDVVEVDYEPPASCPDANDDPQGHDLYWKYKATIEENQATLKQRNAYRSDFLLSMCVSITHYPETHSETWMDRIATPQNTTVEFENEFVSLLKYVVITTIEERDQILAAATYNEVSYEGISRALSKFDVIWDSEELVELMNKETAGLLSHTVRLYEARMARDMGIPFDDSWYAIPVVAREYLIASRLTDTVVENLQHRNSRKVKI